MGMSDELAPQKLPQADKRSRIRSHKDSSDFDPSISYFSVDDCGVKS